MKSKSRYFGNVPTLEKIIKSSREMKATPSQRARQETSNKHFTENICRCETENII